MAGLLGHTGMPRMDTELFRVSLYTSVEINKSRAFAHGSYHFAWVITAKEARMVHCFARKHRVKVLAHAELKMPAGRQMQCPTGGNMVLETEMSKVHSR